jgi:hypothetical protein
MSKKVRLLAQISGSRDGQPWPAAGTFVTVSDDEADTLVRNGQAATEEIEENALLDSHPELAVANRSVAGEEAAAERVAEKPAPHADEEAAYHVPELPGERAAAEAGQVAVDEAQAEQGAQRVESTHEDPKPEPAVLDGEATKRAPRARKATEK